MYLNYILLILYCVLSASLSAAEISKSTDKETALKGWKLTENNFQLELIQRSPQQTRSFFQARGFSPKIANEIATQCVFQTIIKNTQAENSTDAISISLKKWHITNKNSNEPKPIKLKEVWDKEWKDSDISNAARIAFRWATFPTQQTFDPGGDFNWGMISFGPKPDAVFNLRLFWKQGDKSHNAWIRNMQCPEDRDE